MLYDIDCDNTKFIEFLHKRDNKDDIINKVRKYLDNNKIDSFRKKVI